MALFGHKEMKEFAESHPDERVRSVWRRLTESQRKNAKWCESNAEAAKRIEQLEAELELAKAEITAQANVIDRLRGALRESCRDDRSRVLGGCPLLHGSA